MSTFVTTGVADAVLDAVLADVDLVSLHTADPGEAGESDELGEGAPGYARAAIAFDSADGGVAVSDDVIDFEADGDDWPEVTHIGLWIDGDTPTFVMSAPLAAPRQIDDEGILRFAAGAISVSLRGVEPPVVEE